MSLGLELPNGMPMYLLGKLINDFSTIFCQALGNSIYFIGARDHLAVHLEIFNKERDLFSNQNLNWNITYAFDSNEVKRNIGWFRRKANSTKNERLNIIPYEPKLYISNNIVEAELFSFVKKPPIPRIPEMVDGVFVKIVDLKEIVNLIMPIREEVLKLTLSNSGIKMSGSTHNFPIYNVRTLHQLKINSGEVEKSTLCLKEMLLISCQLASEVAPKSAELRFYPGGATQISSQGSNVSVRCLMTAVKMK